MAILVILILLNITGIAELSVVEIAGVGCIFYGSGNVYFAFGRNRRALLFTGTFIFLIGIVLFLSAYFDFPRPFSIVVPSFMFMTGAGFLMLFIDDLYNIILLIIAGAFLILGIASALLMGSLNFNSYFIALWLVAKRYWPVLLILAGVVFILSRQKKT